MVLDLQESQLAIHGEVRVAPGVDIPLGSRFKGYRDFMVHVMTA